MLRDQGDAAAIVAGKVGTYGGGLSAVLFGLSAHELAALVGAVVAVIGLIVQFAFNRRRDLGNTEPGDGVRFKGRGLIQLTGRDNYRRYSWALYGDERAVLYPDMVAGLPDAALAAGWFWQRNGLNALADTDDIRAVTRRVNGGYNGLDGRKAHLARAKAIFEEIRQ